MSRPKRAKEVVLYSNYILRLLQCGIFSWHRVIVYQQHWLYYLHLENEKQLHILKIKTI